MTLQHENKNTEIEIQTDERELEVVREARFFEPYKKELKELFVALDREDQWSDNPEDMLSYMRAGWIGQEHGNSTEKDQFSDEEVAAALPILESIGLTTELLPDPDEKFDQTIVVAGTTTANYRRFQLTATARENGTDLGEEIWLVGQRPREARDGTNDALLNTDGPYTGFDYSDNPWAKYAKKMIEESSEGGDDTWKFTETETARVALLKVIDEKLQPNRIDLNVIAVNGKYLSAPIPPEGAPSVDATDYYFQTEDGHDIVLMNAAAVERKNGDKILPPRHTTASATKEWLERHPPKKGAKVLYVTGNPHSLRTTQDTYKVLVDMERDDIELVVAGTTPAANTPIQTYLGEVARLIDNDCKRNYSKTT